MVLQDSKSIPFERNLWILDMQPDGTFSMTSCIKNNKFLSNKCNTLACGHFSSDDCQLWRQEGNFIKSEKSHGYLSIKYPSSKEYSNSFH